MLNQIILVGRLVNNPAVQELESGKKVTIIKLAVTRSWKNSEGEYDVDFIPITLWSTVAESTSEYCKKGDVIGIKGRIQSKDDKVEVIAEKVTFISSRKEEE